MNKTMYIALYKGPPEDGPTQAEGAQKTWELLGGVGPYPRPPRGKELPLGVDGYERVLVTLTDAWVQQNGELVCPEAVTFPKPTATWGEITHFALMDLPIDDSIVLAANLRFPAVLNKGANILFAPGSLVISL